MDQLFATLDPTMRQLRLPSGRTVILSDTVGFVSDLPHELVAAFRATLEEVLEADVIVHVRDIAHPESEAQLRDVEDVLKQLGIDLHGEDTGTTRPVIEALNKIDLLDELGAEAIEAQVARTPNQVAISALSGLGADALLAKIERELANKRQPFSIVVPLEDGETIAWLYRRGEVLDRTDTELEARFQVLLDDADLARLKKRGIVPGHAAE
ncbi:MAG: 50S ribosome-binding GTPase, partial [Proteobacteria bacterium]|nr:50S ribosome-binding GTPase [Pseudomonadota bacterium]